MIYIYICNCNLCWLYIFYNTLKGVFRFLVGGGDFSDFYTFLGNSVRSWCVKISSLPLAYHEGGKADVLIKETNFYLIQLYYVVYVVLPRGGIPSLWFHQEALPPFPPLEYATPLSHPVSWEVINWKLLFFHVNHDSFFLKYTLVFFSPVASVPLIFI